MRRILALVQGYRNPGEEQTAARLYASYDKGESFFLLANTNYPAPDVYDVYDFAKICSSPYGPTCILIQISGPKTKFIRFINGSFVTISTTTIDPWPGPFLGFLQSIDFVSDSSWIVCGTTGEYSISHDDCITWSPVSTFDGFVPVSKCQYRAANGIFAASQQTGFANTKLILSTDGLNTLTPYTIPNFLMEDMTIHASKIILVGSNVLTHNALIIELDPTTSNFSVLYDEHLFGAFTAITQSKSLLMFSNSDGGKVILLSSKTPGDDLTIISPIPFVHPDERISSDDDDFISYKVNLVAPQYCVTTSKRGISSWTPPLLPDDEDVSIESIVVEEKAPKEIAL